MYRVLVRVAARGAYAAVEPVARAQTTAGLRRRCRRPVTSPRLCHAIRQSAFATR